MKLLILFTALWAVTGVTSSGVTIGITPFSHPVQSQYHSQDVYGQYAYGYVTPTASKSEVKTADGVTRGGYSYIDSNGILQTVEYAADPVHGFRVAATNLPQDLPEVALAKAQHLAQFEATKAEHALIAARVVQYGNPVAYPAASVQQVPLVPLPVPVQELPEVVRARAEHLALVEAVKARDLSLHAAISPVPVQLEGAVVPVTTGAAAAVPYAQNVHYSYVPALQQVSPSAQYHSQDGWGQYSYGYVEPLSSKSETRTADGVTRGGYSYIDANGIVQTVNYVADAVHGFRVAATNIPVGPAEIANAAAATASVAAPIATAPIAAVAAPVATSIHTTLTAPAIAAAPVVAPEIVAAPVATAHIATAAVAAPLAAEPLAIAAPHAQIVNALPEEGWYKQEIIY